MNKGLFLIMFVILCLVSVVSVGVSIYLYTNQNKTVSVATPKADDDATMLAVIGTAIVLPEETPTIISVTDREKLQDQEFFKKAQNGDKVVIYEGIRRIFLYRPTLQKIIDIAPLVFTKDVQATQSAARASVVQTPTATPLPTQQASSSGTLGVEEQGNFQLPL